MAAQSGMLADVRGKCKGGSLKLMTYPSVPFEEYQAHGRGPIKELTGVLTFHLANCASLLLNRTAMDSLAATPFTAILGVAMDPCSTFLADNLGIRRRAAYDDGSSASLLWGVLLGTGHPTSHVAAYGTALGGGPMTLMQRVRNVVQYHRLLMWHRRVYEPQVTAFRQKHRLRPAHQQPLVPTAAAEGAAASLLSGKQQRQGQQQGQGQGQSQQQRGGAGSAAAKAAAAAAAAADMLESARGGGTREREQRGRGRGGAAAGGDAAVDPRGRVPCHLRGQVIITGADWGLLEPQPLPPAVKLVGPLRAAPGPPPPPQSPTTQPQQPTTATGPSAAASPSPWPEPAGLSGASRREQQAREAAAEEAEAMRAAAAAAAVVETAIVGMVEAAAVGVDAMGVVAASPDAAAETSAGTGTAVSAAAEGPEEVDAEAGPVQDWPLLHPPELAEHVAAARGGLTVIYFPPDYRLPLRALLALAEAVIDVRQHIVWRAAEAEIARVRQLYLPLKHATHILMLPEVPLADLMAQPHVVSLVTAGSVQAIYAAMYAAKPVMAVPLSPAQEDLVARVAALGAGQRLSRAELEGGAASFRVSVAIERMRNVYSYTQAMQLLSTQLRATIGSVSPLERAAAWVDYTAALDEAGRQYLTIRSALPAGAASAAAASGSGGAFGATGAASGGAAAPAAGGGGGCMGPVEASNTLAYGVLAAAGIGGVGLVALVVHVCTRVPPPPPSGSSLAARQAAPRHAHHHQQEGAVQERHHHRTSSSSKNKDE